MTIGYQSTKFDSLFAKINELSTIYILIYVDDLIITGRNQDEVNQIICYLDKQLSIKDLEELNYFLGIEVYNAKNSEMILCQKKYISEFLAKTKTKDAKLMPTPMISN